MGDATRPPVVAYQLSAICRTVRSIPDHHGFCNSSFVAIKSLQQVFYCKALTKISFTLNLHGSFATKPLFRLNHCNKDFVAKLLKRIFFMDCFFYFNDTSTPYRFFQRSSYAGLCNRGVVAIRPLQHGLCCKGPRVFLKKYFAITAESLATGRLLQVDLCNAPLDLTASNGHAGGEHAQKICRLKVIFSQRENSCASARLQIHYCRWIATLKITSSKLTKIKTMNRNIKESICRGKVTADVRRVRLDMGPLLQGGYEERVDMDKRLGGLPRFRPLFFSR